MDYPQIYTLIACLPLRVLLCPLLWMGRLVACACFLGEPVGFALWVDCLVLLVWSAAFTWWAHWLSDFGCFLGSAGWWGVGCRVLFWNGVGKEWNWWTHLLCTWCQIEPLGGYGPILLVSFHDKLDGLDYCFVCLLTCSVQFWVVGCGYL